MSKRTYGYKNLNLEKEIETLKEEFTQYIVVRVEGMTSDEAYKWLIGEETKPDIFNMDSLRLNYVDKLSEDIYVQHVDGLEDDDNSITLGYQITKEEFEELLRKS